mmetsp:Transcript_21146/g.42155  ORF Transcript_21146/g.42155 Transcript_21146/m.42155 type:complete len:145 (-) Transcript_21146:48-482(-)
MATGIAVQDDVEIQYNDFKLSRSNVKYFVYAIQGDETIGIETAGEPTGNGGQADWEAFTGLLPEDDCRYGVILVDFQSSDGRDTSKLVFLSWVPDTAPIRQKMLYSGSKEALKRVLVGTGVYLNATDPSEYEWEFVLPSISKFA